MPLTEVLLQKDIGPVLFFYTLVSSGLLIWRTFPKSSRRWASVLTGVALLFIVVIEWINSPIRVTPADELVAFIFGATVILAVAFIVEAVRQAWRGSLRTKLLAAFIGVTVLATGILSAFVIVTTTNNLRGNLERELSAVAVSHATQIGDLFNEQINNLTALSLGEILQGRVREQNRSYQDDTAAAIQAAIDAKDVQWRAASAANDASDFLVRERLSNAAARDLLEYQKVFPDNAEILITDVHGGLAAATDLTSDYNQADEAWWQTAYNYGQGAVYISDPQFDESANALGIQVALPLRDRVSGKIIGILRTTYFMRPLANILKQGIGENSSADIFIPGEPVSRIHEGVLETVDLQVLKKLQAVAGQGLTEMDFEGGPSVVSQAVVQSRDGNQTIKNLGWIVVFHENQAEAFAPVNAQIQGIIIVIAVVILLAVLAAVFIAETLARPITQLTNTAQEIATGNLDRQAQVTSSDEIGVLASAFNNMTARLRDFISTLESRVAERTRNLELAGEVGRTVSQVRAIDVMLTDAAELIRKQFDLYYVQVYLTDPSQTNLILQSGTGTVGAELVSRGHRLPLNTASINGRAAIEKHTVVISNTTESSTFKPNPLLPNTRSEMAVPLMIGEKVVGVLDMQSEIPGSLNQDVLPAFEALAGQIAIAIQNANFLAETQQARAEVESQAQRLSRTNWVDYLDAIHKPEETGFMFEHNKIMSLTAEQQTQIAENSSALVTPITVTGEALGNLVVEMEGQSPIARTDELLATVARQISQQIESLRLLDSAERYRFEAEEASRRLTREGWKSYVANADESISYIYDLKEVRLQNNSGDGQTEDTDYTLPLKVRDETVGRLVVQGMDPGDDEFVSLATAVVERLGAHIKSLRQFEETKRGQIELDKRAQQLAAVAEVSSVSSRELDIQKMLESVVHLTQRQFGLYHAHVFTYNENMEALQIAACGWKEGDEHEGTHGTTAIPLAQEQSLVARAARTRDVIFANDVHKEDGWLPNPLLPDTMSEMAVPLIIGDKLLGVLDVQSDHIDAFSGDDANIYVTLASQVSTALQNAQSFARSQQQAERESTLNIISQKIQSATTVEAVLQIAARELGHALGAPMTVAQLSMKDNK